jgi:hypothetical protein
MSYTLSIPDHVLTDLATGNKEAARQSLLKLVNVEPANTQGWLYLAVALPRAQAILALRRVLVLEPGNQIALHNLKRLYGMHNPRFSLELKDINPELAEKIEEESLATFGHDQPTMNLTMVEAKFGDETPTLPDAFRRVIAGSNGREDFSQLPNLSEIFSDLLENNLLELDLSELETLDAQVKITSPNTFKPAELAPDPKPEPVKSMPQPIEMAEEVTPRSEETIYPPPTPQMQPKPAGIPSTPPLAWVNPSPVVTSKPALPLGRLNTIKASSPYRNPTGAADGGREVDMLRPLVRPHSEAQPAKYGGPWLGFATSGIFAALLVIAVLFSLYWFLG